MNLPVRMSYHGLGTPVVTALPVFCNPRPSVRRAGQGRGPEGRPRGPRVSQEWILRWDTALREARKEGGIPAPPFQV